MLSNRPKSFDRPFTSLQTVFSIDEKWYADDTPVDGSREKFAIESPADNDLPLLGSHPYIFKYPKTGREGETWSEILASYIGGEILKLNIQRTFLAVDRRSNDKRVGVLIESFLKKPYFGNFNIPKYGPTIPLVNGGTVIARIHPNYDHRTGNQHSIELIRDAISTENRFNINEEHFIEYWAKLLAFDALINNGDRHQENWAVVQRDWLKSKPIQLRNELGQYIGAKDVFRFSPVFDNAGGLASELDPKGLLNKVRNANGNIQNAVEKYAKNGKAHPGFHAATDNQQSRKTLTFLELMTLFCQRYPTGRKYVRQIANIDMVRVKSAIRLLKSVDIGIQDADVRSEFILNLINHRKKELLRVCGE